MARAFQADETRSLVFGSLEVLVRLEVLGRDFVEVGDAQNVQTRRRKAESALVEKRSVFPIDSDTRLGHGSR
jgi:hypothetical protein